MMTDQAEPDIRPAREDVVTVLLAEDHSMTKQGLEHTLDRTPDLERVGSASDGTELVRMYKRHRPMVVVTDLSMLPMNGIDATREIREFDPEAQILVLSAYSDRNLITEAVEAGAVGYVVKTAAPQEILAAIRGVAAGRPVFDSHATQALLDNTRNRPVDHGLSERNIEVLRLMNEGLTRKEIAGRMFVSVGTVKSHLTLISTKLGASGRIAMLRRARELGLID